MPVDPAPVWLHQQRQTIGDRVRARRMHQNLTQENLSHIAGISRFTVQRIEGGREPYSLDSLLLIADAIGVPLADLVR